MPVSCAAFVPPTRTAGVNGPTKMTESPSLIARVLPTVMDPDPRLTVPRTVSAALPAKLPAVVAAAPDSKALSGQMSPRRLAARLVPVVAARPARRPILSIVTSTAMCTPMKRTAKDW